MMSLAYIPPPHFGWHQTVFIHIGSSYELSNLVPSCRLESYNLSILFYESPVI